MRIIADLHIHSKYARGCSKDLTINNLEKWARIKGIDLLGTGDAQHPLWFSELKNSFVKEKKGIYYTKSGFPFLLSTEISLIYTQGRGRKIHLVVLLPNFSVLKKFQEYLLTKGRIDYDGRPIFKIKARDFVYDLKKINPLIEVIPAHAWTPWFSVYGSKGGFDSLKEAFGDQLKEIHAIETGISSDIEMNDMISELNNIRYVSFSDAHSYWPWRLGREATIFDIEELSYDTIIKAIRTGEGFWGTIEVEPSYGKYHFDGHRNCNIVFSPEESERHNNICPVCHKPLTIGVLHRILELADKKVIKPSQNYYKLLPLHEIISLITGYSMNTKKVWDIYWRLLSLGENEFEILLKTDYDSLKKVVEKDLADAIIFFREGKVDFKPGFDGVYGKPLFSKNISDKNSEKDFSSLSPLSSKKNNKNLQKKLFDFN